MNRFIDTAWLTHADFRPTAPHQDRRRRQIAIGALVAVLIVGAGHGFAGDLFAKASDLAALRAQRDSLIAESQRLRTELAVESAKRYELERHAADLNTQVEELKGQVEFLKARGARARIPE